MDIIRELEKEQLRNDLPEFNIGDAIRVGIQIVEGTRERVQEFEGIVIKRQHGSIRETFTLRRVSYGVGVERTFALHSPKIHHLSIIRQGKVRRAKLYYLRDRVGKSARVKEKK